MTRRQAFTGYPGPDDIHRVILPNGVTVLSRENFASPAVVVSGYVEAGARDEMIRGQGLANFTIDVMERGTRSRSFSTLYEEVESIGASFGFRSGTHITSFGAKGLSEYLPLLLDILNDVLRNPAFEAEQVEKVRAELITDLNERPSSPRRVANRHFMELLYPEEHPYHWSPIGELDSVNAITADDLRVFHAQTFVPNGIVISVVGGISNEDAVQAVADTFGTWAPRQRERPAIPEALTLHEQRRHESIIPGKSQSTLVLGWLGPRRHDPDFIPAYVGNHILGVFGMYGRLGNVIREHNGLAYYAYSHVDGGTERGPWRISAGVAPENLARVEQLMLDEVRRLQDTPVSAEELDDSQSYLTGSLPLRLETNEGVAQSLINIERFQLGLDYLLCYPDQIRAVTPDAIQQAAQTWLDTDIYVICHAGPAVPEVEQDEEAA